jgi:uncharacterized protein YecE (DUF72 family)
LPEAVRGDQEKEEARQVIYIGTAGWSLPRAVASEFPGEGTHLARYARVFRATEINSSFYKPHARDTYARWAAMTPRGFRFAVKLPQEITHEARLRRARSPLTRFLGEVRGLGSRLGPLLVQLPGSLQFELRVARSFLGALRSLHHGPVVCEPRHDSWFEPRAEALLSAHRIGRVAADPARVPEAARPGGWPGVAYYRLHGSPRMYWSVYEPGQVEAWAAGMRLLPRRTQTWCIFDNTAGSGATSNALQMQGVGRGLQEAKKNADRPTRRPR